MASILSDDLWIGLGPRGNFRGVMASKEPTTTPDVADRLQATRRALKQTQARLCRLTGISTAAWNNAETGDARIGLDNAILLCQATGVTLDWIYRGIRHGLPHPINEAITRLDAAPARKRA